MPLDYICILGIGLELACNGGSQEIYVQSEIQTDHYGYWLFTIYSKKPVGRQL